MDHFHTVEIVKLLLMKPMVHTLPKCHALLLRVMKRIHTRVNHASQMNSSFLFEYAVPLLFFFGSACTRRPVVIRLKV